MSDVMNAAGERPNKEFKYITEKEIGSGRVVYCGVNSWAGNKYAGQLSKTVQQELLNRVWLYEQILRQQEKEIEE